VERGPTAVFTSALAVVEVERAARIRAGTDAVVDARKLIGRFDLVAPTHDILRRAARLAATGLRSLDAVHLASALAVDATVLVAYDARLRAAAEAAGIDTTAPA
jgi:predicted nucleic acid-binding protein